MRYLLIALHLLLLCPNAWGDTYGMVNGRIGRVHYAGIYKGETRFQNQAIAYLCHLFLQDYYPGFSEQVHLQIQQEDGESNGISWEAVKALNHKGKWEQLPGLRIRVSKTEDRAAFTLRLLQFGIENLPLLKRQSHQYRRLAAAVRSDELNISNEKVALLYRAPNDEKVAAILAKKVARNLGDPEPEVSIEYFFQNDRFYFVDFLNKDSVYLSLANVYQIISDHNLGSLIFDTDSTGFFYNRETRRLSTKFKIKEKRESFYFEKTAVDRFKERIYFEYVSFQGAHHKFVFLATDMVLIQGFERIEEQIINELKSNEFKQ